MVLVQFDVPDLIRRKMVLEFEEFLKSMNSP